MKEIKICKGGVKKPGCGKELSIEYFAFRKDTNKYREICKECELIYRKKYYENNKEKVLNNQKEYYEKNKDELDKKQKEYREKNKEEINNKQIERYANLTEEKIKIIIERVRQWKIDNPEKVKVNRNRENEKNKIDPLRKLRRNISRNINRTLKKYASSKDGESSFDYLDSSPKEYYDHIESLFSAPENLDYNGQVWMNWENWGKYNPKIWDDNDSSTWTWNIDHIEPQANFLFDSLDHPNLKKCWDLSNLRPLSAKQNIIDGATRIRHKKKNKSNE